MTLRPDISVIIPSRDTPAELLRRTIDSVLEASVAEISTEVIVVDDCSQVKVEVFEFAHPNILHSQLRVIRSERPLGIGPARNLGVTHSTGNYLTFVDGDDRINANCFARMMGVASQNKIVFANHDVYDEAGVFSYAREKRHWVGLLNTYRSGIDSPFFYCNFMVLPIIIPRAAFLNAGGYPDSGYSGEHCGLYARLSSMDDLTFHHINESLYEYHPRGSGHSRSNPAAHHLFKGQQLSIAISEARFGPAKYSGCRFWKPRDATIYLPELEHGRRAPSWALIDEKTNSWTFRVGNVEGA